MSTDPAEAPPIGVALHCLEVGPRGGPVIALVHGAMDRAAGFAKVARRLVGDHRVLSYDRRGYGHSTPHAGPFGMDAQMEDLAGLLRGRDAVVVGHSYGGAVALCAGDRLAGQVAGIVVYEPALSWVPWWPSTSAGARAIATADPAAAAESFLRRMVGDSIWERLPDATRARRRAEGVALVGELADLRRGCPFEPARITAPVVAGVGSRSSERFHRVVRYLADIVADVTPVELAGCDHGAHLRCPERFVEELVRPLLSRLGV